MTSPESSFSELSETATKLDAALADASSAFESMSEGTLKTTWLTEDLRLVVPELPELAEYNAVDFLYDRPRTPANLTFWCKLLNKLLTKDNKPELSNDFMREVTEVKLMDDQGMAVHDLLIIRRSYNGSVNVKGVPYTIPTNARVYDIGVTSYYDYHGLGTLRYTLSLPTNIIQLPNKELLRPMVTIGPEETSEHLDKINKTLARFTELK